jgi:ectoine hydroxylase-related dioxygenase (phytanoyl-CoA dioxygenase family)
VQIGDWKATPNLNKIYGEIQRLGLEKNIAELEAYGFTVVEPGKAAPLEFVERLRDKVLEVARRRGGGALASEVKGENQRDVGDLIYHMLWEDRIFEEALMNPVALALITYLLGENCLIQSVTGQIKVQTAARTTVHSDNGMIPSPFPPYAQVANATWVLSEYTKANGCLLMVPGSHRHCRHPTPMEAGDEETMVPIEVPTGSMIVWHGNQWHGAFPKTNPETIRVNLIMLFCRMYLTPQEPLRYEVTPEILRRNPPRFAKLVGQHIAYGWTDAGPDWTPERQKYLGLSRTPEERLFD